MGFTGEINNSRNLLEDEIEDKNNDNGDQSFYPDNFGGKFVPLGRKDSDLND